MSFQEIDTVNKNNIERFLKGLIAEQDTLTISYFVQMTTHENT